MRTILTSVLILIFSSNLFAHTCNTNTVKCTIDNTTVEFCVTASMYINGSLFDFEKQGAIGSYYSELINMNNTCYFSGYISDFEKKYKKDHKNKISNFLKTLSKVNLKNEVSQCTVSAKIKELLNEKNSNISYEYLVASYLAKHQEEEQELRIETQCNTIYCLKKAIQDEDFSNETEKINMTYLVAELYRRTSDFENAIIYFDKVLKNIKSKEFIINFSKSQKDLALHFISDNFI